MDLKNILTEWGKKLIVPVICAAIGVGAGYALHQPSVKIETQIKEIDYQKLAEIAKSMSTVEIVHVKDTQVVDRWHREKTEKKYPDGTVESKEVEDRNIDTVVNENTHSVEVKVVEVTKEVVVFKDREVIKKETPVQRDWRVGLLGGINPQILPNVKVNSYAVGAEVEYKLFKSPINVGLWGMGLTSGQGVGGIKVSVDF